MEMEIKMFRIVGAQTNIDWLGRKVTGSHKGTIDVKGGEIILKDGKLAGGKFIIDTNAIRVLDLIDPVANAQLLGHLASDDFFSSDKFPEAVFEITSVSGTRVEGDLTIKGITHPTGFDVILSVNGDQLQAAGRLVVDRTDYGMKFRSGNFFKDLGDNLIYNDFELTINITAKAVVQQVISL